MHQIFEMLTDFANLENLNIFLLLILFIIICIAGSDIYKISLVFNFIKLLL